MSSLQTQALLGALGAMAQVAVARHQQQREIASEQLRAGALAHLVDALVTQRVEAVKQGFLTILEDYARQSQSYLRERDKLSDKLIDTTDLLLRNQLNDRLNDIDGCLEEIRFDAGRLYFRMTEVILALGAPTGDFALSVAQPLQLLPRQAY
jgi:HAMP domain-containing protein